MTALPVLAISAGTGALLLYFTINAGASGRVLALRGALTVALACVIVYVALRARSASAVTVGAVSAGVSEANRKRCTFENVAANEQALESLKELRDYLKDPGKYVRYGARMPKGVLLYGPPGTGKTLLARALAGEANVPFFALAGSDFVEKYVGVGASRVRELFRKARKAGKCVIFIDEIDAIGKRRNDSASDERDQTLNALLSEMSGFFTGDGVVVIAATNRLDALDPALLRPGRFDRQIEVDLPGKAQRLSILKLHSAGKPLDADVNLEELAAQTVSFSGASLENLLNEAALAAAARNAERIERSDLKAAYYRTVAGADRPMAASERERRIIAVHEAGHALVSRLLMPENRLSRVSILPAGHGAAGYNLCVPAERVMVEKKHLESRICVLLAGRAAEQLVFGDDALTAGASSDIAQATELAAAMVNELGMAGNPAVSLKALSRCCGQPAGAAEACQRMLTALYERTREILSREVAAMDALAQALLEAEALEGEGALHIVDANLSKERQESA